LGGGEVAACVEQKRGADRIWWGNLEQRKHFEDLEVDGITLKFVFKKYDGVREVDRCGLGQQVAVPYGQRNGPGFRYKAEGFFTYLLTYLLHGAESFLRS